MSLYKASPNDRFILGFAMVCYMNVLVCCQKALPNSQPPLAISQLLESKKWENWLVLVLTCFFSTSWNPKNEKLYTSFGVDMFFSNSWSPKNGEHWLVLVLTCFFSNFWYWHIFLKLVQVKKWGKFTSFGVDGLKLRTIRIYQNRG